MTFVTLSQPPSIILSFVLFSNIKKTEQTSANPWALSNFLKCQQKMVKQSSVASFHRNFLEGSTIYYRQFFELLWLFLSFMGLNLSIFASFPYIRLPVYQLNVCGFALKRNEPNLYYSFNIATLVVECSFLYHTKKCWQFRIWPCDL